MEVRKHSRHPEESPTPTSHLPHRALGQLRKQRNPGSSQGLGFWSLWRVFLPWLWIGDLKKTGWLMTHNHCVNMPWSVQISLPSCPPTGNLSGSYSLSIAGCWRLLFIRLIKFSPVPHWLRSTRQWIFSVFSVYLLLWSVISPPLFWQCGEVRKYTS